MTNRKSCLAELSFNCGDGYNHCPKRGIIMSSIARTEPMGWRLSFPWFGGKSELEKKMEEIASCSDDGLSKRWDEFQTSIIDGLKQPSLCKEVGGIIKRIFAPNKEKPIFG